MLRNLATELARVGRRPDPRSAASGGLAGPDLGARLRARDRALSELVVRYRSAANPELAAAELLDFLAPAMVSRLRRYREVVPALSQEDLTQQMVLEVLRAAHALPLRTRPDFLERRLMLRAGQAMRRALARENRHRALHHPLDTLAGQGDS
ncbi:MAG: hypothetical protein ACREOS_10020 [Candidatus Dormibacteraceae bacterium]